MLPPLPRMYCKWKVILCEWHSFFLELIFSDVACRGNALGMEDDTISGGGILASSWFSPHVIYTPSQGRLNNEEGSWCPNKPDKDPNPYLQVSLLRTVLERVKKNFLASLKENPRCCLKICKCLSDKNCQWWQCYNDNYGDDDWFALFIQSLMHSVLSSSDWTSSAFWSLRSSHAGIFSIRYRLRHEIRDSDVIGQKELGNIQGKWYKQGEYNNDTRVNFC